MFLLTRTVPSMVKEKEDRYNNLASQMGDSIRKIADFGWKKPVWVSSANLSTNNLVVFMDTANGDGIEACIHLKEGDMIVNGVNWLIDLPSIDGLNKKK
ncbi:hypothetical protein V6N13_038280 [Hibiscus sabdariffa]|uniref:Uncharacterized protein n=1 Tax=Hibiscus sabdariffa TaxID=183260 RepID=A0ABR2S2Y5_9ROSI